MERERERPSFANFPFQPHMKQAIILVITSLFVILITRTPLLLFISGTCLCLLSITTPFFSQGEKEREAQPVAGSNV